MLASYDRKIGNGIKDKKERTGYTKEVAHHKIRSPGGLKFRETVKYIEGVLSFLFDDVVDINAKVFKPVRQCHIYLLYLRTVLNKRLMACKS